jgi:hypothetical protein
MGLPVRREWPIEVPAPETERPLRLPASEPEPAPAPEGEPWPAPWEVPA